MDACTADAGVAPCQKCPERKRRLDGGITDAQLYDMIVAHFGVLTHIAIAVGMARAALARRVKRTVELQAAVSGARRVLIRVARGHLQQALSVGASWAVMFQAGRVDRGTVAAARSCDRAYQASAAREPRSAMGDAAVADAATLKLAWALHEGQPEAVMYCLSHLDLSDSELPYEKIRRVLPEAMFVEIQPEIAVDPMTAPTVGVEIADTSANETLAVEVVGQRSESAPTVTQPGSAVCRPMFSPRQNVTSKVGLMLIGVANAAPTITAALAPTLNAMAALPHRRCANPESRQTLLVCCAALHLTIAHIFCPQQPLVLSSRQSVVGLGRE